MNDYYKDEHNIAWRHIADHIKQTYIEHKGSTNWYTLVQSCDNGLDLYKKAVTVLAGI